MLEKLTMRRPVLSSLVLVVGFTFSLMAVELDYPIRPVPLTDVSVPSGWYSGDRSLRASDINSASSLHPNNSIISTPTAMSSYGASSIRTDIFSRS